MSIVPDIEIVPRNRLLSSMKASQFQRLRSSIETVDLDAGDLLGEAGSAPTFVYFPNTAVLSVLRRLDDGSFMAVASIGHEGVNALPLFLGSLRMCSRSQVVSGGSASRMALSDFIAASSTDGLLNGALRRYAAMVLDDVERAVVCTRFHTISQQFARWLLYTADRLGCDEFEVTHEAVAGLLGVRRATISEAAGAFKRDGVVQTTRGSIAIIDRPRLQTAACVCYRPLTAT
jgi:CRP-like cAMP-binding protein